MNIKRASIVYALAAVTCACTDARLIPDQVADGWGGQRILAFPSSSMVVVLTGGNYTQPHPLDEIIQRHILPALEK